MPELYVLEQGNVPSSVEGVLMYAKNGYGQSSFQRYRAVKIQTASPAQIMLMLYDERFALRSLQRKNR